MKTQLIANDALMSPFLANQTGREHISRAMFRISFLILETSFIVEGTGSSVAGI